MKNQAHNALRRAEKLAPKPPKYNRESHLLKNGKAQKINTEKMYEGNFLKNAMSKAGDFLKKGVADIKRNAKKILLDFKRKYMGPKKPSNFFPGKMLAMNYKAKDVKKKYDVNPLIICLGPPQNKKLQKTHTFGLNMHWMPIADRVKVASFFVELLDKRGGQLRYEDVKPFLNKFKGSPVLRMYIIKNIGSKVIEMPPEQFLTASAIPSEKWMGG